MGFAEVMLGARWIVLDDVGYVMAPESVPSIEKVPFRISSSDVKRHVVP